MTDAIIYIQFNKKWVIVTHAGHWKYKADSDTQLFSRAQNLFMETDVHPTEIPHNEIGFNVKKRKPYG